MSLADVQTLILRPPRGKAVAHLLLRVSAGQGGVALRDLARVLRQNKPHSFASHASQDTAWPWLPLTCGSEAPTDDQVQCSLGFTWRGLEALCVPPDYLRLFSRLAPAFAQGAPLRGARLGDSGASAPAHWEEGFGLEQAHVLLTLHGPQDSLARVAQALHARWPKRPANPAHPGPFACVGHWEGRRLGAPPGEQGEWLHFGFRDGLTDHRIEGVPVLPSTPPQTPVHRAGEFLLGHPNDSGFNVFGLPLATDEVRRFFCDSSFGVLRPLRQEVPEFDAAVARWQQVAQASLGAPVSADWVKAKLCGRWPSGEALRLAQSAPAPGDFTVDFKGDDFGFGCPWAAHVRRMRSGGQLGDAHQRDRPLLRRGMAYGPAVWPQASEGEASAAPGASSEARGLLGLFFCASLEDQFEHLLGQWANRRPLGAPDDSTSKDPLIGSHEGGTDAMILPQASPAGPIQLTGFAPWTTTLGTAYAWHPSGPTLQRILDQAYVPPEAEGPWL